MTGALPTASRPKVGSATGLAQWGQGWCNEVGDGDGGWGRRRGHCRWRRGRRPGQQRGWRDGVALREVAEAPREAASREATMQRAETWAA
jgi:hypothetical protein